MPVKTSTANVLPSYIALIRRFPLRWITSAAELAKAKAIVRELMLRGDDDLDEGEVDYLRVLAFIVQQYEKDHFQGGLKAPTVAQRVQFFMEQHGMKAADLGRVLGYASGATEILKGTREPSKTQIRKLADHFKVSPALFL